MDGGEGEMGEGEAVSMHDSLFHFHSALITAKVKTSAAGFCFSNYGT